MSQNSTEESRSRVREPFDPSAFKYSVVIPVYNSARIVGETIDRTVAFFEREGFRYEIILVNDGSSDGSWSVLREKAREHKAVRALNLLRNYGQHNANLCGFRDASGDYVITMDDDLQNPPEEIVHLINALAAGHDTVFGRFRVKQAAHTRSLGSRVIGMINRRVFRQPSDLTVSNFRIIRADVAERICSSRTAFPYITGLALLYSHSPGNVDVEHARRPVGKSNYSALRIARLVATILFSYSSFPLRLLAGVGFVISALSFIAGFLYLVQGIFIGTDVEGWTTVVVLISFFNGVVILMLSMLGEYVVRTLNQVSATDSYHVVARVGDDG